ncbi:hypothetical protein [Nocardia terpenica]|uniref:Uncharacterized protein n=1 Tax=Nocardia terpenica TaxID=455432 RepID=A0A6G9YX60_9NOCA|nr:hypothetical protein [Nocardia terpenica]QIS17586.1 hypothetical protein F6W96_03980 [Nocardia terpenica]
MNVLTLPEIDAEIAARTSEVDAITATLLELDKHPGLSLLRGYAPTGTTAERWRPVRQLLDLMWEDYGRLQTILNEARTLRSRRTRPTDADRVELTRMLRDRPYEASRTPIPLAQRSLTGPSEQVLFVGIADTLHRMRDSFPVIAAFLDSVDAINSRVLTGLSPLQVRLDEYGGATAELHAIAEGVAELLSRSATDPLSFTAADVDARIQRLTERLRSEADTLTTLRAMGVDWAASVAETQALLDDLRAARARAEQVRIEAERKIRTAPLPVPPDSSARLQAELDALAGPGGNGGGEAIVEVAGRGAATVIEGPGGVSRIVPGTPVKPVVRRVGSISDAKTLLDLRRRIAEAAEIVATDEGLARGLLDRRAELRGRLTAYQAKAARLGVGEDREVLACNQSAAALLSRTPCDLAAVTRSITDYRQIIAEKSGRRG